MTLPRAIVRNSYGLVRTSADDAPNIRWRYRYRRRSKYTAVHGPLEAGRRVIQRERREFAALARRSK